MSKMELKGKTAVITGSGGGVGSILARALRKEGVNLILIEKDLALLDHLKDLVDGPENSKFACDFSKPGEVRDLAEKIKSQFKKIDFLYNIAGIGIYKSIGDLSIPEWELSISINLTSPFILTKELFPILSKSEKGLVLNVGSGMGVIAKAGRSAYCASKFGLRGLSLTLSKELKNGGIDVVLFTLGSIMTNFGPGGLETRKRMEKEGKKYLSPEEVVDKVIEVTKSDIRNEEYVFYPEGYESSN